MASNFSDDYEKMVKWKKRLDDGANERRRLRGLSDYVQVYLSRKNYTNDVDARLDNADLESDNVPDGLDIDPKDWPNARRLIMVMKNKDYSGFWPDKMSSDEDEDFFDRPNSGRKSKFDLYKPGLDKNIGVPSLALGRRRNQRIPAKDINFDEIDDLDLFASRRLKFKKAKEADEVINQGMDLKQSRAQTEFASQPYSNRMSWSDNIQVTKESRLTTNASHRETKIPHKARASPDSHQGVAGSARTRSTSFSCDHGEGKFPSNAYNDTCSPSEEKGNTADNSISGIGQAFQQHLQGADGKTWQTSPYSMKQSETEFNGNPKSPTGQSAWATTAVGITSVDDPIQNTPRAYYCGVMVKQPGCQATATHSLQLSSALSRPAKTIQPVRTEPAAKPQCPDVFLPDGVSSCESVTDPPNNTARDSFQSSPEQRVQPVTASNNIEGSTAYQPSFFPTSAERKIELDETGDFHPILPAAHVGNESGQNTNQLKDDADELFRKAPRVGTRELSREGQNTTSQSVQSGEKGRVSHKDASELGSRPQSVCTKAAGTSTGYRQIALNSNTGSSRGTGEPISRPQTAMTGRERSNKDGDRIKSRQHNKTETTTPRRKSISELRKLRRKDPAFWNSTSGANRTGS